MKKLIVIALFLLPSFCSADRLGSLRSGADVLLTTQTANITTINSSFTVNGANGVLVKYQLNAGSMTGAGLTNCGDSSHAVNWNSTTNLFGCQSIAGSGASGTFNMVAVGTGSVTGYTGTITSSSTLSQIVLFDSATLTARFLGGTTVFVSVNGSSVTLQGTVTAAGLGATTLNSFSATQPIIYNSGTGVFSATPISLSTGVTGSLPAASIAAGLLGTGVIASSLSVNAVYPSAVTSGVYGNITGVGSQSQALNMGTQLINNVVDPAAAQDAATKNYVDTNINSLYWKQSARLATITALPANTYSNGASGVGATLAEVGFGALSIDGVTPSLSDRVLIKNEGTSANNGIYSVTTVGNVGAAYLLTRTADYNQSSEVQAGDSLFITSGTTLADTGWIQITTGTITMGSSPIVFNQFTGLGEVTAGYGLTTSGNVISLLSNTTSYIQNRSTLQSGATSYPDFLQVGSSASIVGTGGLGVKAGLIASGGLNISSGIIINTTPIITSTSTITSTMSVVLASCTATNTSNKFITLTLPDATSNPGADIMIYDVGTDSCSIRVAGSGTDVIESTGIIQLNAKFQHASLHSLGSVGWGAGTGDIQYTPATVWTTQDDVGVFSVGTASAVYQCPVYISVPFSLLGFRVDKPTSSGNASFGLWNMNMGTTPIVTLSSQTLAGNPSNYFLSIPFNGSPGWYRIGIQLSNTSVQITGSNSVNDVTLFCSVGATPSGTGLDLTTVTFSIGGTRNSTYPAVDLLLNGGVLTN